MDDGNTAPEITPPKPRPSVPRSRPHRRIRTMSVVASLGQPKVAVMLLLGFGSGLPFMLIGNTLGLWLATFGVKLSAIGFLSWAGLAFSLQFIWAIAVDRVKLPLFSTLGRRRGWILFCQIAVGFGLVGMAAFQPQDGPGHAGRVRGLHRPGRRHSGHGHQRMADRDGQGRRRTGPAHQRLQPGLPRRPDRHRGGDPSGGQRPWLALGLRPLRRQHDHRRHRPASSPRSQRGRTPSWKPR